MGQARVNSHPSGLCRRILRQQSLGAFRFWSSLAISLLVCSASTQLVSPAWAQAAQGHVRALLIGVSEYEHRALKAHSLPGPRNDVTLMWRRLQDLKVAAEDITVLSDGIHKGPEFPNVAALPTLANIKGELKRLAAISTVGDTVIFFFAGHGTVQQSVPHNGRRSTQAFDQVLLPRDAGEYDTLTRMEENGLLHTELGELLDAIRAKGTFVWAIVDACHAGYSTREITNARVRGIDPAVLKIPPVSMRGAAAIDEASPIKRLTDRNEPGGIAGFFAVDANTASVELPFPADYEKPLSGSGDTRNIGYFTYHLQRALAERKAQTYGHLEDMILAAMKRGEPAGARGLPVFDGTLEHPFLGAGAPMRRRAAQVAGNKLHLQYGSLQGFTVGSGIDVYREATEEAKIATATIGQSEPLFSVANLDAARDNPHAADLDQATVYVELTNQAVQLTFRVARPPTNESDSAVDNLLERAVAVASQTGIKLELAPSDDVAVDAWTRVAQRELLLFSAASRAEPGASLAPIARRDLDAASVEQSAKLLGDDLWRLARAAHLSRIGKPGLRTGALKHTTLTFEARLIRGKNGSRAHCTTQEGAPQEGTVLKPGFPPTVTDGDGLCVFATNLEPRNIFAAVLYVAVNGEVSLLSTSSAEAKRRQHENCWGPPVSPPGQVGSQPLAFMNIKTSDQGRQLPIGHESLVILAFELPAASGSPPAICHLLQRGIAGAVAEKSKGIRRGEAAEFMELLQPSDATRSAVRFPGDKGESGSLVRTYELDVVN
jgi:hypothetical protein